MSRDARPTLPRAEPWKSSPPHRRCASATGSGPLPARPRASYVDDLQPVPVHGVGRPKARHHPPGYSTSRSSTSNQETDNSPPTVLPKRAARVRGIGYLEEATRAGVGAHPRAVTAAVRSQAGVWFPRSGRRGSPAIRSEDRRMPPGSVSTVPIPACWCRSPSGPPRADSHDLRALAGAHDAPESPRETGVSMLPQIRSEMAPTSRVRKRNLSCDAFGRNRPQGQVRSSAPRGGLPLCLPRPLTPGPRAHCPNPSIGPSRTQSR